MNRTRTLIASAGVACACTAAMAQHSITLENADMTADDRLQPSRINCLTAGSSGCGKVPRLATPGGLGYTMEFVPDWAGLMTDPMIIGSSPFGDAAAFTSTCDDCVPPYIRAFTPGDPSCAPTSAPYGLIGDWEAQGTKNSPKMSASTLAGASVDLLIRDGEADPVLLVGAPGTIINGDFCGGECTSGTAIAPRRWGAVRLINARTGCDYVKDLTAVAADPWIQQGPVPNPETDGCGQTDSTLGWRTEAYCAQGAPLFDTNEQLGWTVRWAHSDGEGGHYFIVFAPGGLNKVRDEGAVGRYYVAKWDSGTNAVTTQYVRYGPATGGETVGKVGNTDFIVEDFDDNGVYEVVILQQNPSGDDQTREIFVAQYNPAQSPVDDPCDPGTSLFEAAKTVASNTVMASWWPVRGSGSHATTIDLSNDLTGLRIGGSHTLHGGKSIENVGDVDCDEVPDFVVGVHKLIDVDSDMQDDYLAVGMVMSYNTTTEQFVGKTLLTIPLNRPELTQQGYSYSGLTTGSSAPGSMRTFSALASQDPTIKEVVVGFGGGGGTGANDSAIVLEYTNPLTMTTKYVSIDAAVFDVRDGHLRRELVHEDEASSVGLPAVMAADSDNGRVVGSGVAIGDMNGDGTPDYILSDYGRNLTAVQCSQSSFQSGRIYVSYACAADYNGDGVVDEEDWDDFTSDYTASRPAADFNRDCVIDSVDVMDYYAFYLPASSSGCP